MTEERCMPIGKRPAELVLSAITSFVQATARLLGALAYGPGKLDLW